MIQNGIAAAREYPLTELQDTVSTQIIGQTTLINRVLVALLADGHVLLEGMPPLVKTVVQAIRADFARVQFTPDLLPADPDPRQLEYNHLHGR